MSDDEEMQLIMKESQRYEENIKKAEIREILYSLKTKGFYSLNKRCENLIRIFIGYLNGLGLLNAEKLSHIILKLATAKDIENKLIEILEKQLKDEQMIYEVLNDDIITNAEK